MVSFGIVAHGAQAAQAPLCEERPPPAASAADGGRRRLPWRRREPVSRQGGEDARGAGCPGSWHTGEGPGCEPTAAAAWRRRVRPSPALPRPGVLRGPRLHRRHTGDVDPRSGAAGGRWGPLWGSWPGGRRGPRYHEHRRTRPGPRGRPASRVSAPTHWWSRPHRPFGVQGSTIDLGRSLPLDFASSGTASSETGGGTRTKPGRCRRLPIRATTTPFPLWPQGLTTSAACLRLWLRTLAYRWTCCSRVEAAAVEHHWGT